jgi:FkbM family methyltransferase
MLRLQLPNGHTIYCLNKRSPLVNYREIFEEKIYVQRGITIKENDIIFDVGANIGIFSLFLMELNKKLKVYAFEPIPAIFNVLKKNLADHAEEVKTCQYGLAERDGQETFNYFPNAPDMSTIGEVGRDVWPRFFLDNYQETVVKDNPAAKYIPKFLRPFVIKRALHSALKEEKVVCPLRTLSSIVRENSIDSIDLLKLDAENCETRVLAGIQNEDWPKIQQIAMEVHGHLKGRETVLDEIRSLLHEKGFRTSLGKKSPLSQIGVEMLYGTR